MNGELIFKMLRVTAASSPRVMMVKKINPIMFTSRDSSPCFFTGYGFEILTRFVLPEL